MSQENVELVRRLYAEEPRGLPAISPLDELVPLDRLFRDYYDEQLEIRMPGDYPEGEQVLRGRKGFTQLPAMLRVPGRSFGLSLSGSSARRIELWCLSASWPRVARAA